MDYTTLVNALNNKQLTYWEYPDHMSAALKKKHWKSFLMPLQAIMLKVYALDLLLNIIAIK